MPSPGTRTRARQVRRGRGQECQAHAGVFSSVDPAQATRFRGSPIRLREVGESWEQSLRNWLLRLPCEETKQYVGNFLAVYRVRSASELDNSDNKDDHEELLVTESDLAIACETRVAAAEEGSQQSKWARHRSLVVEAMKQAEARWKPEANASAERKNPYAAIDGKSLAQGARRKPEPVWSADRCAAIESWRSEVVQECNSEQAQFCQKVAEQVLRETRQEDGSAVEPLRWALHGGPGTGKNVRAEFGAEEFFRGRIRLEAGQRVSSRDAASGHGQRLRRGHNTPGARAELARHG